MPNGTPYSRDTDSNVATLHVHNEKGRVHEEWIDAGTNGKINGNGPPSPLFMYQSETVMVPKLDSAEKAAPSSTAHAGRSRRVRRGENGRTDTASVTSEGSAVGSVARSYASRAELRRAAVERIDLALSSGDFPTHTSAARFNGLSSHASSSGAGSSASLRRQPSALAPPHALHPAAPSSRITNSIGRAERDSESNYTADPIFVRDPQRLQQRYAEGNGDSARATDLRRRSSAGATAAEKPRGRDASPLTRIADRAARRGALLSQDGSQQDAEAEDFDALSRARDSNTAGCVSQRVCFRN